ncbi:YlaF family protein [Gracilibacillus caseinilyticus]|uniref:YlaF family protein n=1 Tax=Gracilibacillus caseinilyticus TaxID=2932256 RepID=A0ABY4EUV1_9BACI|nr:DUF5325 family protein [Gracilibacillus caseinilyticus]UOQ47998.1 YlaF family protein [Gracilibacillus caseinilyticus]
MKFQLSKFLLALTVILCFSAAGVGIALRNVWFILIALLAGFAVMGFGISLKKREAS